MKYLLTLLTLLLLLAVASCTKTTILPDDVANFRSRDTIITEDTIKIELKSLPDHITLQVEQYKE